MEYKRLIKTKKGIAGLDVLLSVITFLFMIGLIVMIFALVGGEIGNIDNLKDTSQGTVYNESITLLNATANSTQFYLRDSISLSSIVMTNATDTAPAVITSDNYTVSGGLFTGLSASPYVNHIVNITYSYTYLKQSTELNVINETTDALSSAIDWFDIIIVLTAVVVLILLTVIIIRAVRGTGLMGGESGGQKFKETA